MEKFFLLIGLGTLTKKEDPMESTIRLVPHTKFTETYTSMMTIMIDAKSNLLEHIGTVEYTKLRVLDFGLQ